MPPAALNAPLTLDPKQATTLVLRSAVVEFEAGVIQLRYELVDAAGKVLETRTVTADGAAVQTWIATQRAPLYQRLLAKLGVAGVIT
ncbi:MAG: hypothetical protein WKG32_20965 [Gemmatimonadaceae bacterium]